MSCVLKNREWVTWQPTKKRKRLCFTTPLTHLPRWNSPSVLVVEMTKARRLGQKQCPLLSPKTITAAALWRQLELQSYESSTLPHKMFFNRLLTMLSPSLTNVRHGLSGKRNEAIHQKLMLICLITSMIMISEKNFGYSEDFLGVRWKTPQRELVTV